MPDEAPTTIAARAIVRVRQRIGCSTAGDGSSGHDSRLVAGLLANDLIHDAGFEP